MNNLKLIDLKSHDRRVFDAKTSICNYLWHLAKKMLGKLLLDCAYSSIIYVRNSLIHKSYKNWNMRLLL